MQFIFFLIIRCAYIRDKYTAFLSPFNYNVRESWNDIVLLFCTRLSPF